MSRLVAVALLVLAALAGTSAMETFARVRLNHVLQTKNVANARATLISAVRSASAFGSDKVTAAQKAYGKVVESTIKASWKQYLEEKNVDPATLGFKYAWIAAGSMTRGEMCANSDVEYIMVVDDVPKADAAFRTNGFLAKWQGDPKEKKKVGLAAEGVYFDQAINPMFKPDPPKMIGFSWLDTPKALAAAVASDKTDMEVRSTALALAKTDMHGNDKTILNQGWNQITRAVSANSKKLAMNLATDDAAKLLLEDKDFRIIVFKAKSDKTKLENIEFFDIKKILIRPFHWLTESMYLYYGLYAASGRNDFKTRLNLLSAVKSDGGKHKFHPKLAKRLEHALQAGYRARILAHAHYKNENDKVSLTGLKGLWAPDKATSDALTASLKLRACLAKKLTAWIAKKGNKHWRDSPALKTDCTECNADAAKIC